MKAAPCFAIVVFLTGLAPEAPAAGDDVARAVRILAEQRHGVTAFRLHYSFEERGPGHDKTIVEDSIRVRVDGRLVAVRLLAHSSNGKTASPDELAHLQADLDKNLPADDYVLPLSPDALPEYRFERLAPPCDACRAGSIAIAFTSLKRDESHGDGILLIDEASHRIASVTFHPSVLPAHADAGTISIVFGSVLPDLWDVVETKEYYTGHLFFIHGSGDVLETFSEYGRYASVAQALEANPQ